MRTPITYYGGKQTMAKYIAEMLPEHKIYCEPYFGGGAVFFEKSKSYLEVINDINDKLIMFYITVKENFPSLKSMINNTLHSETLYRTAKQMYNHYPEGVTDIELAWSVWMITNGSFAGTVHGGWKWDNGRAGSHVGVYFKKRRESLSKAISERISETQISCRPAIKVISERDGDETVFYLDPPYPGTDQKHYSGFTMLDFVELLQVIEKIKGKFILSNFWSQTLKYYIWKNNWYYESHTSYSKVNFLGHRGKDKKAVNKTEILGCNFIPEKSIQYKREFHNDNTC